MLGYPADMLLDVDVAPIVVFEDIPPVANNCASDMVSDEAEEPSSARKEDPRPVDDVADVDSTCLLLGTELKVLGVVEAEDEKKEEVFVNVSFRYKVEEEFERFLARKSKSCRNFSQDTDDS